MGLKKCWKSLDPPQSIRKLLLDLLRAIVAEFLENLEDSVDVEVIAFENFVGRKGG